MLSCREACCFHLKQPLAAPLGQQCGYRRPCTLRACVMYLLHAAPLGHVALSSLACMPAARLQRIPDACRHCCRDKLDKLDTRRNKDEEQLHKALDASQRLEYALAHALTHTDAPCARACMQALLQSGPCCTHAQASAACWDTCTTSHPHLLLPVRALCTRHAAHTPGTPAAHQGSKDEV